MAEWSFMFQGVACLNGAIPWLYSTRQHCAPYVFYAREPHATVSRQEQRPFQVYDQELAYAIYLRVLCFNTTSLALMP